MTENEIVEFRIKKRDARLRVLICDDDPDSLRMIYEKAGAFFDKLNADAVFDRFEQAELISEEQLLDCDIALLDVDLEGQEQSGIDLARRLREVNSKAVILFITNFIEYAPEGYEVQAFRYILKRDLNVVLGRYLLQAMEQLSEASDVLQLQSRGQIQDVPFDRIVYLEVQGHSVSVFTDGETYTVNASLNSFEQKLEKYGFLRVHKSYLVNMRHIRKFQCRELTMDSGVVLRVSEKSYAEQKRKYLLWKGWKK